MFNNIKDAINYIETKKVINKDHQRVKNVLNYFNNPENNYHLIHVAGTNGKGSTVAFLREMLINHNYKVGTFTSPHIISYNERISYNGYPIDDDSLLYYINEILKLDEKYPLTFFEISFVISLLYFKDKKIDYAIIEVGIGGLKDVTNLLNYELSLITNIGFDHMNKLGNTLEEIFYQKIGIVKENNYLITTITNFDELIKKHCLKYHSQYQIIKEYEIIKFNPLTFKLDNNIYQTSLLGNHQALNASLSIKAFKHLIKNYDEDKIKYSLLHTFWPGRLEKIDNYLLDGAHNIPAATALINTLKSIYPNQKFIFIYAAMKDKETKKVLDILKDYSKLLILTKLEYYRFEEPINLFNEIDFKNKIIINNINDILKYLNKLEGIKIFTGSLYLVSEVRKILLENNNDKNK